MRDRTGCQPRTSDGDLSASVHQAPPACDKGGQWLELPHDVTALLTWQACSPIACPAIMSSSQVKNGTSFSSDVVGTYSSMAKEDTYGVA